MSRADSGVDAERRCIILIDNELLYWWLCIKAREAELILNFVYHTSVKGSCSAILEISLEGDVQVRYIKDEP